jgi:hypothetical protein
MKNVSIDCRDLVIKCGIKYQKDADGSLFINCPNVECDSFCIRVTKYEFFSFETGIRGDIYALANAMNWQDETGTCLKIIGMKSEFYDKVAKLISDK